MTNSKSSKNRRLGRGVFVFDEDFSPCRLQASLTRSTAQMRTPFCDSESHRGALESSHSKQKLKHQPQGLVLHFWRRKRDSNPRGFGPNGFQDRLVVTASIFLHIIMHAVALWYAALFRSGSWNSFHESASHTPRRRVKLACKRQVRVSSTESKYSYHNANLCYYSSIKFLLNFKLFIFIA